MAVEKNKNMAVSIRVADFNKGNADYFRAHPSVTLCLQKVFSKVFQITNNKVGQMRINFVVSPTLIIKACQISSGKSVILSNLE